MSNNDIIFFSDKLELVIYTIGYPEQGESICVIIRADGIPAYSFVVDSYKHRGTNKTIDVLDRNKISYLDFFCWTHPDADHSVGAEDFIKYLDSRSRIYVSNGFSQAFDVWQNANRPMCEFIVSNVGKKSNSVNRVIVDEIQGGMILKEKTFENVNTAIMYHLKIGTFAPLSRINLRYELTDKIFANNNMSSGLYIQLGETVALLCADIPNQVFKSLENEMPCYVDFIKIPHHGSKNSDELVEMIENTVDIATTTVYKRHGLPTESTLKKYHSITKNIFCTNDLLVEEQKFDYGIHKVVFDILHCNEEKEPANSLFGNATKVERGKENNIVI